MAQPTSKTVVSKKTASPPKAITSKASKSVAAKPTPSKAATTKSATTKSATSVKKPSKAVTTSAKGNGEVATRKTTNKSGSVSGAVTPEQRYRMICDAAYFRAEQRGFIGGNPEQDWRDAENEIDQKLCAVQVQQKNH